MHAGAVEEHVELELGHNVQGGDTVQEQRLTGDGDPEELEQPIGVDVLRGVHRQVRLSSASLMALGPSRFTQVLCLGITVQRSAEIPPTGRS